MAISIPLMPTPPTVTLYADNVTTITGSVLVSVKGSKKYRYSGAQWGLAGDVYPRYDFYARNPYGVVDKVSSTTGSIEFVTSEQTFEISILRASVACAYRIWVDGLAATADAQLIAVGDGSIRLMKVELPTAGSHHIRIENTAFFFGGVRVLAAASITYPTAPLGKRTLFFGDSWVEGSAGTGCPLYGLAHMCGIQMGRIDTYDSGIGGTGYLAPGTAPRVKARDRVVQDVIDNAPDEIFVAYGLNDAATYTAVAVQAEAALLFDALITGCPNASITVIGPWSVSATPSATIIALDTAVKSAAASKGLPYISPVTEGWITSANVAAYIHSDGAHPTRAGAEFLAEKVVEKVIQRTTLSEVAAQVALTKESADLANRIAPATPTDVTNATSTITDATSVTNGKVDATKVVADAIAAKTTNLPASPAAVGSAMTLATNAVNPDSVQTGAIFENALTASAYAHIGASVRTELTTELGRIDSNVSAAKTLTAPYDAAKTASTQASVDAVKAVADAVLVDTGTDIPALIAAAKVVIDKLLKWNTNKRVVSATTQVVYDDDDVTPLHSQSIGVDGTTFTRNKAT